MKVATRITAATAVVVALACAAYAFFDLRSRSAERKDALEREARALASTLRVQLEAQASAYPRGPSDLQLENLSRGTGGWKVTVVPKARVDEPSSPDLTPSEKGWLRTMIDAPSMRYSEVIGNTYAYALALRAAGQNGEEPQTTAMLEISRPSDVLKTTTDDLGRAAILIVLIALVTTLVVGLLASRLVSRPITKLLRGIDDVAKGDLSHVILSERDDEIGQIALRFNEMTFSLRESRGETQRQNEAKLALEQRLGQTEKLATIGQLAAEIAHEVGTPLNVIAGRARSIQKKAADHPEAVEKNAEIIAEQTARITRIIQRLLDFTRRKVGSAGKGEVNLNEIALTTMELLSGQFASAKVKTRLDRAEGLPRIAGDQRPPPAGDDQSAAQRRAGDARWRLARRRDARRAPHAPRPRGRAEVPRVRGQGHRRRHPRRHQGQDLRPVLHDEGRPRRHRPRPRGLLGHRQGARRLDRRRGQRRRRHGVPRVPARVVEPIGAPSRPSRRAGSSRRSRSRRTRRLRAW